LKIHNTFSGKFINRPNRFIAHVELDHNPGIVETVHVKNTGRCKELLLQNSQVVLEKSNNPNRKTQYDLIAVYKNNLGWVNIDSQLSNKLMREWLEGNSNERKALFPDITLLKPECTFGKSRIDFYLECGKRKILIEVKGCTLEIDGIGYFPDAPTERGVKHLGELASALSVGYECYIAYVITMPGVTRVLPNIATHAAYGEALSAAKASGVKELFLSCDVKPDQVEVISAICE